MARRAFFQVIPTAAAFDSFWDFQIEETLTRCLLMREEQTSMGGAVAIRRVDLTAAELRAAAGGGREGRQGGGCWLLEWGSVGRNGSRAARPGGWDGRTFGGGGDATTPRGWAA